MATMTQAQCDACLSLTAEKRYQSDGVTFKDWFIRYYNENNRYDEFEDLVSLEGDDAATIKTNAHAFMTANREFLLALPATHDPSIDIS